MTVKRESQSSSALASSVFSSGGNGSSSSSPSSLPVAGLVTDNDGAGTGESAILTLVPGAGAAAMGAGAKLNPEDNPAAGAPTVALLLVEPKENVGVVEAGALLVEFCIVEPNENPTGAGAGAKSDLDFSVALVEPFVRTPEVLALDGAGVLAVSFAADSDRRKFMVVRYRMAGN